MPDGGPDNRGSTVLRMSAYINCRRVTFLLPERYIIHVLASVYKNYIEPSPSTFFRIFSRSESDVATENSWVWPHLLQKWPNIENAITCVQHHFEKSTRRF